jgi:hypothetical protein
MKPTTEKFKKNLMNYFNKIIKQFDKDDVLDPYTQAGVDIFKYTLMDDNNVKYLSPKEVIKMYIVTKEYVINKDISTFIIFEYNPQRHSKLTTVNYQYRYDYEIPSKTSDIMKKMFDDKVEMDRKNMENEILNNITSSIQILVAKYKSKLEKQNKNIE